MPFTRAGCDVGDVGTANTVLENTAHGADRRHDEGLRRGLARVERGGSHSQRHRGTRAGADRLRRHRDPLRRRRRHLQPATRTRRPDPLPDEPGGYTGFKALFGAKYVDPAITGGNPCVNDTTGQPITDPFGHCGFPGFDGMFAKNTLGYVAQMQEAGVPVTYALHLRRARLPRRLATDAYSTRTAPARPATSSS